jgi:hypothetical protein
MATTKDLKDDLNVTLADIKGLHGSAVVKDIEKLATDTVDVVKTKVRGLFHTNLGYQLNDPTQNVTILPAGVGAPVAAEHTDWVQGQIDAGLVTRVGDAPAVAVATTSTASGAPEGYHYASNGVDLVADWQGSPVPPAPAGYVYDAVANVYTPVKP